ncbi:MAG: ABC transporter ATP-binding protein [Thermoplasmata archaeon]
MENAIETFSLTKKFKEITAVDGISLSVKSGELFGFLGPNGAGKSTTIRMLCTLLTPTSGSAKVAGFDIVKEPEKVREHIGLVSEKMIMYDRLTAYENLRLFGKLYGLEPSRLNAKIDELLALVNMEKWRDTQIGKFSTGMKQRINVIRALLHEPDIVFLDEPTLGLDPHATREVREFVRKLNMKGTTVVITTHIMYEAELLCHRIGIIDKGKIVALDTSKNLKKLLSGEDVSIFEIEVKELNEGIINELKNTKDVSMVSVSDENPNVIKVHAKGESSFDVIIDAIMKQKGKVVTMKDLEPTLEDVFIKLTGRELRDSVSEKVKTHRPHHAPKRIR